MMPLMLRHFLRLFIAIILPLFSMLTLLLPFSLMLAAFRSMPFC